MNQENNKYCIMCGELATTEHQGDAMCQECKDNELDALEEFEDFDYVDNAYLNFPYRDYER